MAEVSFSMFGGGGGYSTEQEEECTTQFDTKIQEKSKFYVGGGAFEKDPEVWYKALTDDVGNITQLGSCTEIEPLFDLKIKKNFPEIEDIEEKAAHTQLLLTAAYCVNKCDRVKANGGYCENTPFDAIAPEDQIKKNGMEGGPNNYSAGEAVSECVPVPKSGFGGSKSDSLSTTAKYNALDCTWDEGLVRDYPEALTSIGAVA